MLQKTIGLVVYSPDRGFELTGQAEQFLLSLGGEKFAVMGVVGKARTGKSYIINQLIGEQVFPVHGRVAACTKGILMSPVLRQEPKTGMKYLAIDTEGLGNGESTEERDSKLFLLNMLTCSLLIYNSVGIIDEHALNALSLVVGLGKCLNQDIEEEDKLSPADSSFPSFFWLIRDFVLKMQTQQGRQLTSKQYLQKALEQQKGVSTSIAQKNRIRRVIKGFFRERDCETLVRPTDEQQPLYNLQSVPKEKLRPQFSASVAKLRTRIFRHLKLKKIKGCAVTGRILVNHLKLYIDSINKDSFPRISHIWKTVKKVETEQIQRDLTDSIEGLLTRLNSFQDFSRTERLIDEKLSNINNDEMEWLGGEQHLKSIKQQFTKKIVQKREELMKAQQQRKEGWLRNAQAELAKPNIMPQLEECFDGLLKKLRQEYPEEEIKGSNPGNLKLQLENSYLQTKLIKLSKTEADKARQDVQLGFAKKQVRFLAQKNLTLEKERSTLIKTIESQQKCIEELRQSIKASRSQQLSMGVMSSQKKMPPEECSISAIDEFHQSSTTNPNSHSINIVERVLEMYRKLEEKHQHLQSVLENCTVVVCNHCNDRMDFKEFELHYEGCKQARFSQQSVVLNQKDQEGIPNQSCNSQRKNVSFSPKGAPTKTLANLSNPSFFTPYLMIPNGVLFVEVSKTLIKEDSQQRNYIEYTLEVRLHQSQWSLNRKYKDFCELHDLLLIMFPRMGFPESSMIMKNSLLTTAIGGSSSSRKAIIEQRRKMLEEYIRDMLAVSEIRNTRILQKFLKINKQYQQLDYLDRSEDITVTDNVSPLKQLPQSKGKLVRNSYSSGVPTKLSELRLKLSMNRC